MFAFFSIRTENELTAYRLSIPQLSKEVKLLAEENTRLRFEKERFESAENLLKIAASDQYTSLLFPIATNVSTFPRGFSLAKNLPRGENTSHLPAKPKLAFRAP